MTSSHQQSNAGASSLRPELKNVLSSLTVHLDDELLRYRRQVRGQAPIPSPRIKPTQTAKSLDLIAVPAQPAAQTSDGPTSNIRRSVPIPPPPPPNPFLKSSQIESSVPSTNQSPAASARSNVTAASPEAAQANSPADALAQPTPDDKASPNASLEAFFSEPNAVPPEARSDDSLSSAAAESVAPELALHQTQTSPDGYLESSEELLKSLAADADADPETIETPPKPYNPTSGKATLPLKLGTLLLLLTASAGIGYAIINPSILAPARSWFAARTAPAEPDPTTLPSPSERSADSDFVPPGPDLSSREFVDLDLDRLSTLKVDPSAPATPLPSQSGLPTPATTTAPAITTAPATTTAEPSPSATAGGTSPSPTAPATVPSPAADTTVTTPTSPSPTAATGSNYYVVASFTGDASLTKTRTVVSDAFVRNFNDGTYIQVAAFDNEASAQQQRQALQQQGLTVQIYGPTDE
ncbi:MAG: hypothetical protein AAFN18_02520 [Cyanobacteria bacterium J06554_6]